MAGFASNKGAILPCRTLLKQFNVIDRLHRSATLPYRFDSQRENPMKLHLTRAAGNQLITGYGEGWVDINDARHTSSLIVLPNQLVTDWPVADFTSLAVEHIERIAHLAPEVVLLGTGKTHRFAHPRIGKPLLDLGISLEYMDTAAACRTYNILMAEGRHVAAALII